MPCFVNKVGIAGNRINFTSDSLEISILALQVFKLGRAHKGEVRRIEEEHAPLAEKILISDFDEIVLLECIQFEFANFFTVERHLGFLLIRNTLSQRIRIEPSRSIFNFLNVL